LSNIPLEINIVLSNIKIRSLASVAAGFMTLGALAGCGDWPVDLEGESYVLAHINGQLPGPYPDPALSPDVFEVTAGTLTLRANGTLSLELVVRCRSPLPTGTQCSVEGDGREIMLGRYERAPGADDGVVELAGRSYPASFGSGRVTVVIGNPPSMGFSGPRYTLEFRR
jgi:hypothetical protein